MKGKGKAVILLVTGILGLVTGTGILSYGVLSFIENLEPVAVVQSPGKAQFEIDEPGIYTLWHDHETIHHGQPVSHGPSLPSGFDYLMVRDADRVQFRLAPTRAHTTLSTGSRNSIGVGTFEPNRAGAYTLQIRNPSGDNRVFSLTKGSFFGGFARFGLSIVAGGILILAGLAMLVLGIVLMVMKPKTRTHPPTAPPPFPG